MTENTLTARYRNRYLTFREELGKQEDLEESLLQFINDDRTALNNYFMAGLGMGTFYLRLGAVILLGRKLHDGDPTNDMMFMRQVLDNLHEVLPSDTNWRNVWQFCADVDTDWMRPVEKKKQSASLLERFVTFRNRYAHGSIKLDEESLKQLIAGVSMLDEMAELEALFAEGSLEKNNDGYIWQSKNEHIPLHPFLQEGEKDGLPYVFQGMYEGRQKAKLLNTLFGNEQSQSRSEHFDDVLAPFIHAVNNSIGQEFDHSFRLDYYTECLIGREKELDELIQWSEQEGGNKIFPVYALAGMGKGALMAGLVRQLQKNATPTLFHFCGSGQFNNLQAVLYHFIYQAKRLNLWEIEKNSVVANKLERLPSKYIDTIRLFQKLLSEHLRIPKNFKSDQLIIVLDGLDDAAVSDSSKSIGDWFKTYDEEEQVTDDWTPPANIKWVFTYRVGQYQFPLNEPHQKSELLQPMPGIAFKSCAAAFEPFKPSDEFLEIFGERGAVVGE